MTVFASKLPVGEKDHRRLNPSSASGSPTFLLTAPLGGRYRVLAREQTESQYLWAVSDEVTLDENQPIAKVRLALPEGQPLRIKVVDPDGRPVAKQPVHLEVGFSQAEPPSSFATNLDRRTDADGLAFFDHLALNADITPLRVTYYVSTPPTRFMGFVTEFDPRRPLEIRLQRGLSASGVVVEAATGKPIPRAEVRIFPRDFARAQFKSQIHTKTNERGEFHFEGLEDQEYTRLRRRQRSKGDDHNEGGRWNTIHARPTALLNPASARQSECPLGSGHLSGKLPEGCGLNVSLGSA